MVLRCGVSRHSIILDSLDTFNYTTGNRTIMVQNARTRAGNVSDPRTGKLYLTIRGRDKYLNGTFGVLFGPFWS